MEQFFTLDALEVVSEEIKGKLLKEKDKAGRALLEQSLNCTEIAKKQLPVEKKLKLENIQIDKLYGEGSIGLVWQVSSRNIIIPQYCLLHGLYAWFQFLSVDFFCKIYQILAFKLLPSACNSSSGFVL
jgi:hypothetical protein